ncbi:MAG: selenide, water dikinase SelD [Gemmobacter sp.]|nr:selenide, water dikinase SelD [Gemmobacter sp.]
MMPLPQTRDLVLIGGGHAHALVLRAWAMNPLPGVRLTVINPDPVAPYTGMLPGHIAGHYGRADLMIDLVRLARFAGARVILGRVAGIDRTNRMVIVPGRAAIGYDIASVDIGIASDLPNLPGFPDHAVAAKPLGPFAAAWDRYLVALAAGRVPGQIVVIGAGVGGVELSLAMAERLRGMKLAASITLLEQADTALPGVGTGARAGLLAALARYGVTVRVAARPQAVTADSVVLEDGTILPAGFTLGVAGARPQGWLAETGLDLEAGFISVGPTLQSSDPLIFAVGDCAHMTHAPRPKAGVFAVRQAPVLLHNMRAALGAGRMRTYRPQGDYLKLISTGAQSAVADKWGLRLDGAILWRWKDRIDRRFMAMFHDLPAMAPPQVPRLLADGVAQHLAATPPLCGGCGAKVPGGALRAALEGLPAPARADVIAGAGDDAAVLTHGAGVQVITTDHLRAFTPDAYVMARIAALHALGDVWAMGAAPQVALAQVTLPPMSDSLQARTLAEILSAAGEAFRSAGADLVGGHTTIGAELTIGFTVTGLADRAVTKGGAKAGDALILTRGLGSGVVMAAEMAHAALPDGLLGEAVAATLTAMQRSGRTAAHLLRDAHALTDVTGFGLAGHLVEMLDASSLAAMIDLSALPLLPGAEALAGAGVRSSLWAGNKVSVTTRVTAPDSPRADLMYDPQTAGGFLAAVPNALAPTLIAALRAAGEDAAVIGHLSAGIPHLTCN